MRSERLQASLENDEPKCANCRMWSRWPLAEADGQKVYGTIGQCLLNAPYPMAPAWFTADLNVCSKWEAKDE